MLWYMTGGVLQISQGMQPPGQWLPPLHLATTHSTCVLPTHMASDQTAETYGTQSYAIHPAASIPSPQSHPDVTISYVNLWEWDIRKFLLTSGVSSMGINHSFMSEVDTVLDSSTEDNQSGGLVFMHNDVEDMDAVDLGGLTRMDDNDDDDEDIEETVRGESASTRQLVYVVVH